MTQKRSKTPSRQWLGHGFWNLMEHGITRGADAASSLLLLWALTPELFSKLALAQAAIAPLLFFFLSPETVMYRDYSVWQKEGRHGIAGRIRAFRRLSWGKGQLAIVLSLGLALLWPGEGLSWSDRFFSLIWAFSLSLAPQISGPDREFLRMELRIRELSWLSFFQKLSLLAGTAVAALIFPGNLFALAGFAAISALGTAWMARWRAEKRLPVGAGAIDPIHVLKESLTSFSLWQHLLGVVLNWVQTMDVLILGVFRFPAREVGLYAAVLKLANLTTAAPNALCNLLSVWIGRRDRGTGLADERRRIGELSLLLVAAIVAQAIALWFVSPWILSALSHGRWSGEEMIVMRRWLAWMLTGIGLFASTFMLSSWLALRTQVASMFVRVYLPFGVFALATYSALAWRWGLEGAAGGNVAVMVIYWILLIAYDRRGSVRPS